MLYYGTLYIFKMERVDRFIVESFLLFVLLSLCSGIKEGSLVIKVLEMLFILIFLLVLSVYFLYLSLRV